MEQQLLSKWIDHPECLNKETLYELRALLAQYPFFQTARLLYLKNLYLLHDVTFGEELRKAALYVTDVKVLFYMIEGNNYVIKPVEKSEIPEGDPSADRTLALINSFLAEQPESFGEKAFAAMDVPVDVHSDYTSFLSTPSSDDVDQPQMKGQGLIDSFLEKTEEAIPEDSPLIEPDRSVENQEDVLNTLLAENEEESEIAQPLDTADIVGTTPPETTDQEEQDSEDTDISTNDGEMEDESFFTETLAKIYVKQHRYLKALEIIKKLNLKYPKKNAYFADQIRFLEKLIINTKSE